MGRSCAAPLTPLLLLGIGLCPGQQPAPSPSETGVTIVVNADEVSLDLVVREHKGTGRSASRKTGMGGPLINYFDLSSPEH